MANGSMFSLSVAILLSFSLSYFQATDREAPPKISYTDQERGRVNPGPRFGHVIAYDENRDRTVLFGGFGPDGIPLGDTWEWDGRRWHRVATKGPSPRKWPAMAYDSKRHRMILFGGLEGIARTGRSRGDTWRWDGQSWTKLSSSGPSARDHHKMVYDRERDRIVLFGGWDDVAKAVLNDTWEWNGVEWEPVRLSGPSPRAAHAMAYDGGRRVVVLFGGRSPAEFYGDTWLFDGREWSPAKAAGPAKRAFHALAFDSHRQQVLLFGGRDGPKLHGDTWTWDGTKWLKLSSSGPPSRGVYAMAYDGAQGQAVIFGGGHRENEIWMLHGETWLWDGQAWLRRE